MIDTLPTPPQTLYNVLPPRYRTWLKFYDDVPLELREAPRLRWYAKVSREQYQQLFGDSPKGLIMLGADFEIIREYMLARIAEELLPSRLSKADCNSLEATLYQAGKYDSAASFSRAVELLTPIWAVARDKQ